MHAYLYVKTSSIVLCSNTRGPGAFRVSLGVSPYSGTLSYHDWRSSPEPRVGKQAIRHVPSRRVLQAYVGKACGQKPPSMDNGHTGVTASSIQRSRRVLNPDTVLSAAVGLYRASPALARQPNTRAAGSICGNRHHLISVFPTISDATSVHQIFEISDCTGTK